MLSDQTYRNNDQKKDLYNNNNNNIWKTKTIDLIQIQKQAGNDDDIILPPPLPSKPHSSSLFISNLYIYSHTIHNDIIYQNDILI